MGYLEVMLLGKIKMPVKKHQAYMSWVWFILIEKLHLLDMLY
ncbi:hypothetical protein HMPREF0027_2145 [Actinobacillus ureae ATCC 25976]|uniref:Uncharacterized protein n=1 Tax=Actinobacillus ureae ATCC 25976 TaxID=887324 RepID=E8KJX1_9PAST|nr:hypothetical protein HMPREF0027_2145 [Actinobacillus ureae ATCC 25976]